MKQEHTDIRKSLRASFKDGIFASIMIGMTEHYIIPFALFLNATVQQVGWISSLPNLLGSFVQLFAVDLVQWIGGRLRLLVWAVATQATLLLAIALLAWGRTSFQVQLFLFLLILFTVSGAVAGPAWGSLMSDYIPAEERGVYFGRRNRIMGIVNVLSMIAAGLVLYWSPDSSRVAGFFIIFFVGASARFVSAIFISRMVDMPHTRDPSSDFSFFMFVARFRESNFVKFVAFMAMLTFSAYLAAPFFTVFMLRGLGLSYLAYTTLQVISMLAGLLSLPWWGKHADLVGNVRVLRLCAFATTVIPLLWLFWHNMIYLAVIQMLAGFAWSGVTLCSSNFIYDAVTPQKRVRCIGYFNVLNGTALFAGATLGGYLASRLPPLWGYPLHSLFAISSLMRLLSYFLLFRRFDEVRPSRKTSSQDLFFSVVGIRPLVGGSRDRVLHPIRARD